VVTDLQPIPLGYGSTDSREMRELDLARGNGQNAKAFFYVIRTGSTFTQNCVQTRH
jgi:hypothetical protein